MAASSRVLHDDGLVRVIHKKNNGKQNPEHIIVVMEPRDDVPWSRTIKMSIDELFSLTEALDDICDGIEDEEEVKEA